MGPIFYEMVVIVDGVYLQTYSAELNIGDGTEGPSVQNPKTLEMTKHGLPRKDRLSD